MLKENHFAQDPLSDLKYKEIKRQIEHDVILNESFYNGILNVRIGRPPKNFVNA